MPLRGWDKKYPNDIGWHLVKSDVVGADSVRKKKNNSFGAKITMVRRIFSGVLLGRGVGGFVLETPHNLAPLMSLVGPNKKGRFKALESKSIILMFVWNIKNKKYFFSSGVQQRRVDIKKWWGRGFKLTKQYACIRSEFVSMWVLWMGETLKLQQTLI